MGVRAGRRGQEEWGGSHGAGGQGVRVLWDRGGVWPSWHGGYHPGLGEQPELRMDHGVMGIRGAEGAACSRAGQI